jgi:hypothetical protein
MSRSRIGVLILGMTMVVGMVARQPTLLAAAQDTSPVRCPMPVQTASASPESTVSPETQPQLLSQTVSSSHQSGDTLLSGKWSLPHDTFIAFHFGDRALVTVESGEITLLVCDGKGTIDAVSLDRQTTVLAEGESLSFTVGGAIYLFLDIGRPSFRIYGASQQSDAIVAVEVLRWNTAPQVCALFECWEAEPEQPELTACKDLLECMNASTPVGCTGIRCWVI